MECKRDYGTNILIVNQDKIVKDYNILRKPNYSFHIYDNNQLEFRKMEYIENDLINENDQFTIDVERRDEMIIITNIFLRDRLYPIMKWIFCNKMYIKNKKN